MNKTETNKIETAFANQFNMERNLQQTKGTAVDFICMHTGRKYELKDDKAAAKTGNVFLELIQTNDSGLSWNRSGLTLAADQSHFYVIKIENEYLFFNAKNLKHCYPSLPNKATMTRPGKNGNKQGSYAWGITIPVSALRPLAIEISPVE